MRTAVVNVGGIVSGDWREPFVSGDAILMEGGRILKAGNVADGELPSCDVVIDAGAATAIPGLIDLALLLNDDAGGPPAAGEGQGPYARSCPG